MVTPKGKPEKGGGKWTPLELDTDMTGAKEQRKRFKLSLSHPSPVVERPVSLEKGLTSLNLRGQAQAVMQK